MPDKVNHTLNDCLQGLVQHRAKEGYAILGQGMWLLNAFAIHALPVGRPAGKHNVATVATLSAGQENEGFVQWLRENVTGPESPMRLSQRTCYNYMKAAQQMGLKAGDGEAELAALEASDALGGRRISDLYKLEAGTAGGAGKNPSAPPGGPEQMWLPFATELSTLFEVDSPSRMALYEMPVKELDEIETRLRFGLDAIKEIRSQRKGAAGK